MKVFFDTEFMEDGERIIPLSLGAVREDGTKFYAVFEADHSLANEFVKEHVLPRLGNDESRPRNVIADLFRAFADVGGPPQFWAYYADYDWVILCQMYGRMVDLPEGWPKFCMDLKQFAVHLGNPSLLPTPGNAHHALADADWVRNSYDEIKWLQSW